MKKMLDKAMQAPLDVKIFLLNSILLIGLFYLPDEPKYVKFVTTYIVFIFVSIAVSSFFMTWVRDSKYNILRKAKTSREISITLLFYIGLLIVVSYIISQTEWVLFIFVG